MGSSLTEGGMIVISDMLLALLSVVANLIVITSLREWDGLMNITYSFLVANLCLSNLISAVFVKSISVVRNGYAVASNSTENDVAFCALQSFGHRATLAVYPWTLFFMCWVFFIHISSKKTDSSSLLTNLNADVTDEEKEPGILEKSLLGTIWSFSMAFGFLSESCQIKEEIYSFSGLMSFLVLFLVPVTFGPILTLVAGVCINVFKCDVWCWSNMNLSHTSEDSLERDSLSSPRNQIITELCEAREATRPVTPESLVREGTPGSREGPGTTSLLNAPGLRDDPGTPGRRRRSECYDNSVANRTRSRETSSSSSHICCLVQLTLVHVTIYFVGQILPEVTEASLLYYVLLKSVVGTSHHLLIPLVILFTYPGIRASANTVFLRGGTIQNKSKEIAMSEVKKELGIISDDT